MRDIKTERFVNAVAIFLAAEDGYTEWENVPTRFQKLYRKRARVIRKLAHLLNGAVSQ